MPIKDNEFKGSFIIEPERFKGGRGFFPDALTLDGLDAHCAPQQFVEGRISRVSFDISEYTSNVTELSAIRIF